MANLLSSNLASASANLASAFLRCVSLMFNIPLSRSKCGCTILTTRYKDKQIGHKPMKSRNRIFLLTTNIQGTIEKLSQNYLFPNAFKTAQNPVVFLFLCRFYIRDPGNVHTQSTHRVTITKFSNCTFKR